MVEKKVPYQVNGRSFEGMIVYDDSVKTKRPAIFMQPDWKGVDKDTIGQARAAQVPVILDVDYPPYSWASAADATATTERSWISSRCRSSS